MKTIFQVCPELHVVDAAYKLLDLPFSMCSFLSEDLNVR